jgi:L-fuconolactonase
MPNFPIIDSHIHLWEPTKYRVPWLDNAPTLNKTYGVPEYKEATAGSQVEGFVYLEIDIAKEYTLSEAKWLAKLAETEPMVLGIVPYAPIHFGEQMRPYLEELVAISPKIKGIRRLTQGETDPAFCLYPKFIEGTKLLPEFGLSFDLCIYHTQFAPTIELVRQCPETSFILDHVGKASIRTGEFEPWGSHITELSKLPNVVIKVSGVLTEAKLDGWTIEDVKPYVHHVLNAFGEDRVVFGSDWPVLTLAASHQQWVDVLDELTVDLSDTAKQKLWRENARRFYRL